MHNLIKILSILLFLSSFSAQALNTKRFQQYEAHFVTLKTTSLSKENADFYGLERHPGKAYLNFSFLNLRTFKPQQINITGSLTNVLGKNIQLKFQEIKEEKSFYYIAFFNFKENESYKFTLNFSLSKNGKSYGRRYSFKFKKKNYND